MPSFFFQDDFSCFYILIMHTIYSLLHSNLLVLNFPKFKMMKIGDQKKLFSLEMHTFLQLPFSSVDSNFNIQHFFFCKYRSWLFFSFVNEKYVKSGKCHFVRGALYTIFLCIIIFMVITFWSIWFRYFFLIMPEILGREKKRV